MYAVWRASVRWLATSITKLLISLVKCICFPMYSYVFAHVFVCICMYLYVFACFCMFSCIICLLSMYLYVFVCICMYFYVFWLVYFLFYKYMQIHTTHFTKIHRNTLQIQPNTAKYIDSKFLVKMTFSNVFICICMFFYVFPYIFLKIFVAYQCISMYFYVFLCFSMFSYVFSFYVSY